MWNYLFGLICISCALSSTGCASSKRKAEQMLKSEITKKRINVDPRHKAFSPNTRVACNTHSISFPRSFSPKPKVSKMLKPETAKKRMNFERIHQETLSSKPKSRRTWRKIKDNPCSECQWLLRKIFPKKSLSEVSGDVGEVTLMYKHIKDEENKPFPQMQVAALLCRFPRKCVHGTRTTFIRSPDPNCAFYMNRLANRTDAYFISEEICKWKTYPGFWNTVLDGERRTGHHSYFLHKPDKIYQQEEYEAKHRLCYLKEIAKYRVWPELEHEDTQIYCHMIFEKYLPGTMIGISDIQSKQISIELFYKRIKDKNGAPYPPHQVCSFSCEIKRKFHLSSFQFIRSSNLNCLYLVAKSQVSSRGYWISKEVCDQKWHMKNFYLNIELFVDISFKSTYVQA